MVIPASATVKFKGDNLAKVIVGGHLMSTGASISADALADEGGPGGGDGGDGGDGGNGGPGGTGFGANGQGNPVPGQNGQPGDGAAPGPPGLTPRQGGIAGGGNEVVRPGRRVGILGGEWQQRR